MAKQTRSITTLLPLLLFALFAEGEGLKLFVFGDSYVDTGNFRLSQSYLPPYGVTYPGKPAGRFSDGRVLTDFIASYLNISSPAPYALRSSSDLQYGMNFAYGGSGIFDTLVPNPNMTVQINLFETLIQQNVYTKQDLQSSVALVSSGGNDYAAYLLRNRNMETISSFTASLINQLSTNLKRLQRLGIPKIAVSLLQPVGCLPSSTVVTGYRQCIDTSNGVATQYGQFLLQKVQEFNRELGQPVFVTLDLYNSFLKALQRLQGGNALRPCCVGVAVGFFCGSVDVLGPKYTVCPNLQSSFFWDIVHPSQNGWAGVFQQLKPSISQLIIQ